MKIEEAKVVSICQHVRDIECYWEARTNTSHIVRYRPLLIVDQDFVLCTEMIIMINDIIIKQVDLIQWRMNLFSSTVVFL
jgi:hypothetical protein